AKEGSEGTVSLPQVEICARAGQQAGHAHRGDCRELRVRGLELDRAVLRQHLLQRDAELVTQSVDHDVGDLMPVVLEGLRYQAVEGVGVSVEARGRPARGVQVLYERALHGLDELPVPSTSLLDDLLHQPVRVQQVACRLLELALQAVGLSQARQVEGDQVALRPYVGRQLPLEVLAGVNEAHAGADQLPLRLALAAAGPHRAFAGAQHPTGNVQVAVGQAADRRLHEAALFEGEGIPRAQVLDARAKLLEMEVLLDGLGPFDVVRAADRVGTQLGAYVFDDRTGGVGSVRNALQRIGQRHWKIEHELAEEHVPPQLVGDGRPRLAARLQVEPDARAEELASLLLPAFLRGQRVTLMLAGRKWCTEDLPGGFGLQART